MKEWTKPEVHEVSLESEEDVLVDCQSSTDLSAQPTCGDVAFVCWAPLG